MDAKSNGVVQGYFAFEQQCTSDNCLKWDWKSAKENPKENPRRCQECFQKSDVEPYNSFVGKHSYPPWNFYYRDREQPFTLDQNTKKCILRCISGYWVENYDCDASFIKPDGTVICKNVDHDPLKQRCVSDNCKRWGANPNICT
jgi:hypothetical protein